VGDSGAGVLDTDLRAACLKALNIAPEAARAHAEQYSWEAATTMFRSNLAYIPPQQFAAGVHAWSEARFLTEEDATNDLVSYLPRELRALLEPPPAPAACDSPLSLSLVAPGGNGSCSSTVTAVGVLALPRSHGRVGKASTLATFMVLAQAVFWGSVESTLLCLGKPAPPSAWGVVVLLLLAGLLVTRSFLFRSPHKQRRALGLKKPRRAGRDDDDHERQLVGARTPPMSPASSASVSRASPSSLSLCGGCDWDSS